VSTCPSMRLNVSATPWLDDPNNRENVVVPWIDGLSSLANNVWLMGVEMTNNDNLQARLAQASQGVNDRPSIHGTTTFSRLLGS